MPIRIPTGKTIGQISPEGLTIYNPMFWKAAMKRVDTHGGRVKQSEQPQVKKFAPPAQVATRKNRQPQRNINLLPGSLEESFDGGESYDYYQGFILNMFT